MESNRADPPKQSTFRFISRHLVTVARIGLGIGLLAVLLHWGTIDFQALTALGREPLSLVLAIVLVLATLPFATLRWGIILRTLDLPVPLTSLLHIQCISTFFNQLLFGPTSGDAIRGLYAWRLLRRGSGRIAASIVVDRMSGLLALMVIAAASMLAQQHRIREVPQLTVLAGSLAVLIVTAAAGFVLSLVLLRRPGVTAALRRFDRLNPVLDLTEFVIAAFQNRLASVTAVIAISIVSHVVTLIAFVLVWHILQIGTLSPLEIAFSAALALIANMLPITPGGLGVGETAFDQLCRWLETTPSGSPYASVFFAFRAVSMLTLLVGLASFVIYRGEALKDSQ